MSEKTSTQPRYVNFTEAGLELRAGHTARELARRCLGLREHTRDRRSTCEPSNEMKARVVSAGAHVGASTQASRGFRAMRACGWVRRR